MRSHRTRLGTMGGVSRYRALLFDIGEVISAAAWPMLDDLERSTGRHFAGRGPLDPEHDPLWHRYLEGELSYLGYWEEVARAAGYGADWKRFFADVAALPVEHFCDPDAADLIRDAHAAGLLIGALTNEGAEIAGMGFFETVPEMQVFDAYLDAAEFGERKPAAEPYLRAAAALGVDPTEVVFLDDTPACVWGADAVGMTAVLVDGASRKPAFDRARELLGIAATSPAEVLVRRVEAAFATRDTDRLASMLDPDVTIVVNGTRTASGLDHARRHLAVEVAADLRDVFVLRGADLDADGRNGVVTVERRAWTDRAVGPGPDRWGIEVWTLRRGQIMEWYRYDHWSPAT